MTCFDLVRFDRITFLNGQIGVDGQEGAFSSNVFALILITLHFFRFWYFSVEFTLSYGQIGVNGPKRFFSAKWLGFISVGLNFLRFSYVSVQLTISDGQIAVDDPESQDSSVVLLWSRRELTLSQGEIGVDGPKSKSSAEWLPLILVPLGRPYAFAWSNRRRWVERCFFVTCRSFSLGVTSFSTFLVCRCCIYASLGSNWRGWAIRFFLFKVT